MRLFLIPLFALLYLIIGLPNSYAQNTGGVFGPVVNEDHKLWQYRITIDPDNANETVGLAQRLHYEQSINGRTMWRVVGQLRKTNSSDLDFDFVQGELFWQMTEDSAPLQSGLRFDARYRGDNRPEQFGLNWMNQVSLGEGWTARAVALSAIQTGDNAADGVFLQTRGNIFTRLDGGQTLGFELYNNFGNSKSFGSFKDQGHTFGPFISAPVGQGLSVYGGALFGLSEAAADTELRLWVTKSY